MASTINADNGVISGSSGVKTTADASGVLALQSNGTTGLTLNTSLAVGVGSSPSYGTSGQVLTSAGSGAPPTWVSAGITTTTSTTSATSITLTSASTGYQYVTMTAMLADRVCTGSGPICMTPDAASDSSICRKAPVLRSRTAWKCVSRCRLPESRWLRSR